MCISRTNQYVKWTKTAENVLLGQMMKTSVPLSRQNMKKYLHGGNYFQDPQEQRAKLVHQAYQEGGAEMKGV